MTVIKGGDKLQAELQRIAGEVKSAERVQIGFLEGATYPDGTPVAMIAAIQNWGAPKANIPPRPFLTDVIVEKSPEWGPATAELLKQNNYDAAATLAKVGEAVAGQIRESITKFNGVPLAPSTIKKKGSAKQLVDTGHMLQSVDYAVVTGD